MDPNNPNDPNLQQPAAAPQVDPMGQAPQQPVVPTEPVVPVEPVAPVASEVPVADSSVMPTMPTEGGTNTGV